MVKNMQEKAELYFDRPVLIVDDDQGLRNLVARTLKKSGIHSEEAECGTEAIEKAVKSSKALLLLDQQLTDMTGRDVIDILASKGHIRPFIIMTGQGDERLAVEMMKLGAEDYLVKDTEFLDRLPGVIERVFRNIETEEKLAESESEKVKLQNQLFQAQKMESVGRLAGGVAHDFNNMIGAILGYTELALNKLEPEHEVVDYLQQVHKAAQRSADLTRQLLAFARKQTIAPKVIDLNEAVSGMMKILQRLIGENITLELFTFESPLLVNIDPSQIDQLLANLCVNSRDAISNTGKITIKTELCATDDICCDNIISKKMCNAYVMLSIEDNGCGIDETTKSHLFEPFYTTKELGRGTGLGLATVYGIVQQNEGFIDVISYPNRGTTFKIFLPNCAACIPANEIQSAEKNQTGNETVLLVEDEEFVLKMTLMMLQHLGYNVVCAGSPEDAIKLAQTMAGKINVLVTDVVMPKMNGRQLAEEITRFNPDMATLYISGYTADVIAQHGAIEEGTHFLQKPFNLTNLSEKMREVLNACISS